MGGGRTRDQYLEMRAEPEAAGYAREHVRRVLSKWGREDILETAELVASELATNAVKATWERVHFDDRRLWVIARSTTGAITEPTCSGRT
ncbi:hypothetical protein ABZU32_36790 [Sphaerisporangium sp. NPDC005288]|uniref:ATP-binding protein n=1 Tax=Sphaerisporangium sp. NPDC005288 TaxID=3155114 RepID=UPI00339F7251